MLVGPEGPARLIQSMWRMRQGKSPPRPGGLSAMAAPMAINPASKMRDIAGKGVDIAGKGVDIAGKGVDLAGKGVDLAGKGVDIAGRGVDIAGSVIQAQRLAETEGGATALITKAMNKVNPLAYYLHPYQRALGRALVYVRIARRVASWEDRRLTLWLYLALVALAVALWLMVHFVPWSLVLPVVLRALGFAATGPHMLYVGRRFAQRAEEEQTLADEFEHADRKGKAAILARHRESLLAAAADGVKKELTARAKLSPLEQQRAKWYSDAPIKLQFHQPPVAAQKYTIVPDASCSSAIPGLLLPSELHEPPEASSEPASSSLLRHRAQQSTSAGVPSGASVSTMFAELTSRCGTLIGTLLSRMCPAAAQPGAEVPARPQQPGAPSDKLSLV